MSLRAPFRMQIRTRLTVQFICITAGIFVIALVFIYTRFQQYSEEEYNTLLESKALMTANMVLTHEKELSALPEPKAEEAVLALPYSENITIYDASDRRVFATNASTPPLASTALLNIRRQRQVNFHNGAYQAFGSVINTISGKEYIVVSEGRFDDSKLDQLGTILLLSFVMVVTAIALGGYFFAGQALRPVSRIVREVAEILPTDLSRRLQVGDLRDELSQLVGTFNQLLDRIEQAFRMQRSFISNVSHEIKNPLAAMDAQLQFARQRERTPETYREVLDSLHEDVHYIAGTAEKLLQLAKIHAEPHSIAFALLPLDELLFQTRETLLKSHPDYTVVIEMRDMPDQEELLNIKGNEPLLRTALLNLFENGCKFSPDHRVHVLGRFEHNGAHEVAIRNAGPGIPSNDLQRIFEPFFRSPQHTGVKGSGVGLSLVQSIIHLHRASIEVLSEEGYSTTFRLRFPALEG